MHGHDQRASIRPGPTAALAASLLLPGTAVVDKTLGLPGVVAYLLLGGAGLLIAWRRLVPAFLARIAPRAADWLAGLTLVAVIAIVLLAYPLANSGRLGGGSDRDDALNLAARALLAGQFPYAEPTYLGNPISPLPGAILLSAPFVLLGTSAYQNIFWLAAFYLILRRQWRDPRHALLLTWAVLLSPAVLHSLATGGDLLANALYVLVITAWLLHAAGLGARRWLPAAAALGLAISSRANFLLLLPLLFAYLERAAGWRRAAAALAVTITTTALVTVPFILVDPAGFTPGATAGELAAFNRALPGAHLLVPAVAAVASIGLAAVASRPLAVRRFWQHNAFVQAIPVLAGLALTPPALGRLRFGFAEFGLFFLFFGAAGWWPWRRDNPPGTRHVPAMPPAESSS